MKFKVNIVSFLELMFRKMFGIQSIVITSHVPFLKFGTLFYNLLVMRMAEIGNGNIDPEYNRKMLGSARPRFLPSTGLSYSSDSADTE